MYYESRRPSRIRRAINSAINFLIGIGVVVISLLLNSIVFGLMVAFPIQLLWNYCLVGAFHGVPQVGFLHMAGIIVMCRGLKGAIS